MSARQQAFDFFVRQGWTREQSAGIVANLEAESELRPDAIGDSGAAYGLAQWHGDRQAGFEALLGKPIRDSTLQDQLYWVHAELQRSEKKAGDALAACTTAAEAGACVSRLYERPADREGEATKRAALAERILAAQIDAGAVISPPDVPTPPPQPEKPVGALALLQMFAPMLSGMIPQISPLLKPGSKAEKLAPIAQLVIDTITKTTGQSSLGGAVQAMQADSALTKTVQAAVVTEPQIMESMTIGEVGGGAVAARDWDVRERRSEVPFWKGSAVFYMSLLLLPLVYWLVGSLIIGGYGQTLAIQNIQIPEWTQALLALFGASWTGEARSGGFNLVIGLILGGICGVYFGVSVTQAKQSGQPQPQKDG